MPTIRQLARLAGVSPAAVSLALRGKPGVSAATRARIQALADEYQYRLPAPLHPDLRGRFPTIGYVTLSLEAQGFAQILNGILEVGFRESVRVVPLRLHGDTSPDLGLALEVLIEQGIDGLLIRAMPGQEIPPPVVMELYSREIAVVCIDHVPADAPFDCVASDATAGGWSVVEYLYGLGHRDIAILRYSTDDTNVLAMMRAAKHFGMTARYVMLERSGMPDDVTAAFALPESPTAFVCQNDYGAALALIQARRRGVKVPQQLSIVGYGNYVLSGFCDPRLATVEAHNAEVGRRALTLLLQRIQARRLVGHYPPETILLPPELLPRETIAPPRRRPRRG
jgi:DNA-binding LacI/PurR family transcriptional regulator